jgi:ATP-dependent Clp protease ATP-binding subunit ClpX
MLSFEGVDLSFTKDALDAVAKEALERSVGARGLRIILEELMLDIMYKIPSMPETEELVISRDVVEHRIQPLTGVRKKVS